MKDNEILAAVVGAESHVAELEKTLPEMVKIRMRSPKTGFQAPEEGYGIYKSTGGRCLGVVGKVTQPTQPKFLLNTLLNTVLQNGGGFDLESIKYVERKDGTVINFSVDMDSFEVPTKLKTGDITKLSLLFSTSYNSKQSNRIDLYTHRCFCDNGQVRRFKTSSLRIRNTKAAEGHIENYFYDIGLILNEVEGFKEDMLKLAAKKVNAKDIERTICRAFNLNADVESRKTAQINKHAEISEAVKKEIVATGKTAYGLLQGLTRYINHTVGANKDADYLITGGGLWSSIDAEKAVLELLK